MVPLLGIGASLIGAARRVRPSRSWSEPLTLWTSVIGFSGTGKTPGLDVSRRALSAIDRSRKHELAELVRAYRARVGVAKAFAKKWTKQAEEAVAGGNPAPAMPEQAIVPAEFTAPRLFVSNVTIERLAALVQARPRGMLMVCDELAGLFLNMSRYTNGTDKEFWLEAWNGGSYVQERQSRPAIAVDHLLVGVVGGFQPDKLARSFAGDDDGMYGRMLFAWPPEPSFQPLSNGVSEVEPDFQTALTRLIDLRDMEDQTFVPKDVPLSDMATKAFEHFRQFLHLGRSSLEGREREWWSKGETHVLRLAGTLTFLDWAMPGEQAASAVNDGDPFQKILQQAHEPTEIGDQFMAAALKLWREYFWPHAQACLRQVGLTDHHANARRVLRWLQANCKTQVSLLDVRRDALKQQLDARQTEALLDKLEQAGWLKKSTEKMPGGGPGRPRHRWIVNSILLVPEGLQKLQEMQKWA
jgi:hypothetical protein